MEHIKKNYEEIKKRIEEAAEKAGRKAEEITFVAVSKTFPAEYVRYAAGLGITDFGENKVQEMTDKMESVDGVSWHLIGHLQTNKVKKVVGKVRLIQSLDSVHLAEEIDKQAKMLNVCQDCLVEVNIGREANKFGVLSENVKEFVESLTKFNNVCVRGLMCVAPFVEYSEKNRKSFLRMRELFLDMQTKKYDNIDMTFLSMGMSGDFDVAVSAGANVVRIGTALFGKRG